MAVTYEPIATTTFTGSQTAITFSSIPSTYTDLRVVFTGTYSSTTQDNILLYFNNDTSGLYSQTYMYGNGTSAASSTRNGFGNIVFPDAAGTISYVQPALITIDLFSYANSTYKTSLITLSNDKNGSGTVYRYVGLYRSTTAISTVNIKNGSSGGTFASGGSATLYGIKAA